MAEHRSSPPSLQACLESDSTRSQPSSAPIYVSDDMNSRARHSYDDSSTNYEEDEEDDRSNKTRRCPGKELVVRSGGGMKTPQHDSSASARDQATTTTTAGPGPGHGTGPEPELGPDPTTPELSRIRLAIKNFTSQWFLVPQGTGITSIVLYQFEDRFEGLDMMAYIFWALTAVGLLTVLLIYITRVFMFPRHVFHQLANNVAELAFLSSSSIAFTSVNQMISLVSPAGNPRWASVTAALWWFNVSTAMSSTLFIPYCFARIHKLPTPGVPHISPATQLPMIAAITLAAGGGVVSSGAGQPPQAQTPIIFVSYLSIALALPLIMTFTAMYLVRLLNGSMLERSKVYQDMILAGPWGQVSFALQVLGRCLVNNAPAIAGQIASQLVTENSIMVLGYSSIFLGFLSWGHATFWWVFAIISIAQCHIEAWGIRKRNWFGGNVEDGKERYSLTVWSLVFPWGTYTNAAIQLGKILGSPAFRIFSIGLTFCLFIITLLNLVLTVWGLCKGTLLGTRQMVKQGARGKLPAMYK